MSVYLHAKPGCFFAYNECIFARKNSNKKLHLPHCDYAINDRWRNKTTKNLKLQLEIVPQTQPGSSLRM